MNRIYYLLALVTLLFACKSETKETKEITLNKNNLFGEVKSVRDLRARAEKDAENGTVIFVSGGGFETVFNRQGNKVLYLSYESDGSISSKRIYKYDDEERLIEKETYYRDKLSFRDFYSYDDKGNMIEKTTLDADGALSLRQRYVHNDKGNVIEERHHNDDDVFYNRIVFEYDEKDNVIEENNFDANDLHCLSTTYQYDDNGNMIEKDFHSLLNSMFDFKNQFKYDEKGNVIEEVYLDGGPSKRIIEYEFDEKGNWIKSIAYKYGEQQSRIEREIEYFE